MNVMQVVVGFHVAAGTVALATYWSAALAVNAPQGPALALCFVTRPSVGGGGGRFYEGIDSFVALGGATVQPVTSPSRRTVKHRPARKVHVQYVVHQD